MSAGPVFCGKYSAVSAIRCITAGGGAVTVVVTGRKTVEKVTIAPSAVDPEDVEMLEDLVTTAINEAMRKVDEMTEKEMGKITGGMKLPGMF